MPKQDHGAPRKGRHILITGASSGIGAALAQYYARPGVHLSLWARNQERLEKTAEDARSKGASVETRSIDLSDAEASLKAFGETDDQHPIDILILSAGMADIRPEGAVAESADVALKMSMVNFATPVALATEAANRMAKRRRGRIGLMGSVASFHDLPLATVYSGSKAGIGRFSTALHAAMVPYNVRVTLIAPGFIDTPMSQRLEGDQAFLVPVDKAARKIARAINAGKAVLVFPWAFQLTRALEAVLPRPIAHRILRGLEIMQHPSSS
ncbi:MULTISPECIES: SDR family oxidoreductase [unclassified Saccharibacter]|uniref:SDR family NAD(P)-dependent oxidoreductase n=1 Tax=unclassified Saccharibacter TaxID=2648722 RepID=UPI0013284282|nr:MULTISPECIES: SDR family NAD(P)-dependent oxidoreductase [unclassified Saccharibacter]MXV35890.1 SDR family NAD(P)-dependent oxidoreductase [Saccharibacter sp. EH611]MXV58010.1 SDR family NAD(P)-dependent oxidoreductase [Saccharibacter sp. EH70]MXV66248.1 SDR family NAD(P)-dependent oxidoreductase [Saccharibacter sp. EH60]